MGAPSVRNRERHEHRGRASKKTIMAFRVIAICVWLMAACATGVEAIKCEITGELAPTESTMMASPIAPETEAIILWPNCSYITRQLDVKGHFSNNFVPFDRVASVPSFATSVTLNMLIRGDVKLASGVDLSRATNLTQVRLGLVSATTLLNSKFPPSLDRLSVYLSPMVDLTNVALPARVGNLDFGGSNLTSLSNLPRNVTTLRLYQNNFTTIDFDYPSTVETLIFDRNKNLSLLGPAKLPPRLKGFSCDQCPLEVVRGLAWPRTLSAVKLQTSATTEVEVRESDVEVFTYLAVAPFTTAMSRSTCSDESAVLRSVRNATFCVITDERYESLYGKPFASEEVDGSDTSASSSSSSNGDSSPSFSTPSQSPSTFPIQSPPSASEASSSSSAASTRPPSQQQPINKLGGSNSRISDDSSGIGANQKTSSVVSSSVIAVAVLLGIIVTATLAAVMIAKRTEKDRDAAKGYRGLLSPSTITQDQSSSARSSYESLEQGLWNDPTMLHHRVELDDMQIGEVVAASMLYVTLHGYYDTRRVALKRLAEEVICTDQDTALIARFMDEIRLCSTLDHPKIVEFVGVTWSCLQDLSLVSEFMDGGDLDTLLHKQPVPASREDWFEPWTATNTVKCKAMIALDIADAIVYLHSFNAPILHRDLKTRNVFLDSQGNAKLSGFGISRELSLDETMTGEVGTVAWIAPEVLRGDRYSDKADIYSLGVLLVELDRCRHPYAAYAATEREPRQLTNTQIAVAVVSGQLSPRVSEDSPEYLKELVKKCTSFEADDRPSAIEVHFGLRQLLQRHAFS